MIYARKAITFFRTTKQTNWGKRQIVDKLTDMLLEMEAAELDPEYYEHTSSSEPGDCIHRKT